MAVHTETESSPPLTTLVSGIINDAQQLMAQQLSLFQHEIKADLRKTRDAAIPMVVGLAVAMVGVVLVGMTLGFLIPWIWPSLPTWAGFAISSALLLAIGGGLMFWAKTQFDTFTPLPEKSLEALKENVQWVTKK